MMRKWHTPLSKMKYKHTDRRRKENNQNTKTQKYKKYKKIQNLGRLGAKGHFEFIYYEKWHTPLSKTKYKHTEKKKKKI